MNCIEINEKCGNEFKCCSGLVCKENKCLPCDKGIKIKQMILAELQNMGLKKEPEMRFLGRKNEIYKKRKIRIGNKENKYK